MNPAVDYIYQKEAPQRTVMLYLHEFLVNEMNLQVRLRYKIPFYDWKSWICYMNPVKPQSVELAFVRGNELSNEQGLLESKGRKQVMGVTFENVRDIPLDTLREVIQEALILDETVPYPSKRKK